MKKYSFLLMIAFISMIVLAACGGEDASTSDDSPKEEPASAYEPVDIDPDTDVCEVCAMAVADDQHATQIVLTNDRSLPFDDLGCLYEWKEENGTDDIGEAFVRDFHTEEWIPMKDATYVYGEDIDTPMAYGIISFKEENDAKEYIEEHGDGEILTSEDLDDHTWEMMNHDHHDHHGHDGDHGEAHGFHTDGFDMHFTELEHAHANEESMLEVSITIDDTPLEDARVRYEIWQEEDEENTDWIDASSNEDGMYEAAYTFSESATYHVQIHVEDDADLHEHMEVEVDVKE